MRPIFAPAAEDPAHQFKVEYRVADAAASPYLALGAIVWAGVEGIRGKLSLRPPDKDFWAISEEQRLAKGFLRLPRTLGLALQNLAESPAVRNWFGATSEALLVEGLGYRAERD